MAINYLLSPECPGQLDANTHYEALAEGRTGHVGVVLQGWLGDPLLSVTPLFFCTSELAERLRQLFGIQSEPLTVSADSEYDFFLSEYRRLKPRFRRLVLPSFSESASVGLVGPYLLAKEEVMAFLLRYTVWADLEYAAVPAGREWSREELSLQRPSPRKQFPTQ
jgi:hypothetical protein